LPLPAQVEAALAAPVCEEVPALQQQVTTLKALLKKLHTALQPRPTPAPQQVVVPRIAALSPASTRFPVQVLPRADSPNRQDLVPGSPALAAPASHTSLRQEEASPRRTPLTRPAGTPLTPMPRMPMSARSPSPTGFLPPRTHFAPESRVQSFAPNSSRAPFSARGVAATSPRRAPVPGLAPAGEPIPLPAAQPQVLPPRTDSGVPFCMRSSLPPGPAYRGDGRMLSPSRPAPPVYSFRPQM